MKYCQTDRLNYVNAFSQFCKNISFSSFFFLLIEKTRIHGMEHFLLNMLLRTLCRVHHHILVLLHGRFEKWSWSTNKTFAGRFLTTQDWKNHCFKHSIVLADLLPILRFVFIFFRFSLYHSAKSMHVSIEYKHFLQLFQN